MLSNYEVLKHVGDMSVRYAAQPREGSQQEKQKGEEDPFVNKPLNLKNVIKEVCCTYFPSLSRSLLSSPNGSTFKSTYNEEGEKGIKS